MSARFAKVSHPIPYRTWGDRIVKAISIGGFATVLALMLAMLVHIMPASARDVGQWEGSNPLIQHWYKSLMQPDNPSLSCCGEADAYWADQIEFKNGKIIATITDTRPDEPLRRMHVPPGTRIEVPPYKLTWRYGNPVGHAIIFLRVPDLGVLCFVQSSGV